MSTPSTTSLPLAGLRSSIPDGLPSSVRVGAANMLRSFGATIGGDVRPGTEEREAVPGLPLGTLELFWAALVAGEVLRGDGSSVTERSDALDQLLLPAKLSRGRWRRPPAPLAAIGGGSICADVAAPDDAEIFDRFLASIGERRLNAEALAAEAQAWRLPVTPYRCRAQRQPITRSSRSHGQVAPAQRPDVRGVSQAPTRPMIVDLTAMWSGPLCTRVLADAGAVVHKVEPGCRPDGTRLDEHGLHDALNSGKTHHDLDLRLDEHRVEFEELVAEADIVIDNFSPRVRPNLGITRAELSAINPEVLTLSLPAFAAGTNEREWVAYGTGVHAISGLGMTTEGPCAPAITYPDPIAGAIGAATATAMLVGRSCGWRQSEHVEVSLASAIEPLQAAPDDGGEALRAALDDTALVSLGVL